MRRKLVKQGAATLMVSLPSKWAKANRLDKGDEVDIEEDGSKLVISKEGNKEKQETTIELTGLVESLIRTLITNNYREGFDKITVSYQNEEQFKILSNVVKTRLIGFDITSKVKGKCVVENITEPSPEQFDVILQKIFLNIESLMATVQNTLAGKETDEDCEEMEERIQQYDNFCKRILTKSNLKGRNTDNLILYLTLINHAQREIYLLSKVMDNKVKVSKDTLSLLEKTSELFLLLKKTYETNDKSILADIHKIEKELIYKKGYSLLEKSKGKESIILYHLLSAIRRFYQANSPLAGIVL